MHILPEYWVSAFEQNCLEAHNEYRALHGSPPLVLSPHMCQEATSWAEGCAKDEFSKYNISTTYGQNVHKSTKEDFCGSDPVNAWYADSKHYRYHEPGYSYRSRHFTQLIWESSVYLGVGVQRNFDTYYVCTYYSPAGNIFGAYRNNVKPIPRTYQDVYVPVILAAFENFFLNEFLKLFWQFCNDIIYDFAWPDIF